MVLEAKIVMEIPPPTKPITKTTYRECLKNHAASIGGHALDGCGEFMAPPYPTPTSLKCAACGCHRNFHRRFETLNPIRNPNPNPNPISPTPSPESPPPVSHLPPNSSFFVAPATSPAPAQMLLALRESSSSRKRFRTKFSAEQKEKMCSFAERVGWKMQRVDEKVVVQFCDEIGVRKGVLKVWMHNNKHTLGTKKPTTGLTTALSDDDDDDDDNDNDNDEKEDESETNNNNNNDNVSVNVNGKSNLNLFHNASSSSS